MFCNLPFDDDGDHIADGQDLSLQENGYNGPVNVRDPETLRSTALSNHRGDGFSDYEEYRGVERNNLWSMLNPRSPDVFIEDANNLGVAGFPTTEVLIWLIADTDHSGGVVNWSSPGDTVIVRQGRLLPRDAGQHPDPGLYGQVERLDGINAPGMPFEMRECRIYTTNIMAFVGTLGLAPADVPAMIERMRSITISHELVHGCNVNHHPSSGPWVCYMRYPNPVSLETASNHSRYCTASDNAAFNEVNRELRVR